MYSHFRHSGTGSSRNVEGTTITVEHFKFHFSKLSTQRFECNPKHLYAVIKDRKIDTDFRRAAEKLNAVPNFAEIEGAIKEVKDSDPAADKLRKRHIWNPTPDMKTNVVDHVHRMFTSSDNWEQSAIVEQMVAFFKEGDRQKCGKYWAPNWTEWWGSQEGGLQKRVLETEKVFPRVWKPGLLESLRRQGLCGNFLHCTTDLHETKNYWVKNKQGMSSSWTTEQGLKRRKAYFTGVVQPVPPYSHWEGGMEATRAGIPERENNFE